MIPRQVDPAILAPWMATQRWYANKGSLPVIDEIASVEFDAPDGVRIVTHLILDHAVGKPALYQVPLTYRSEALLDDAALVARIGDYFVYDAPHDEAYTAALLAQVRGEHEVTGSRMWSRGHRAAGASASGIDGIALRSRVLTGEQSNTSIIFEGAVVPVILKLFRALHNGENPDVELQTALAAAGSDSVPQPIGHVVAEWPDTGEDSGRALGHLAFAQEFLPGARDAWRAALDAAMAGRDFSAEARELGVATARVHATLAAALDSRPATPTDIDAVVDHMHGRLALAVAEVPALAALAPTLAEVFEHAGTVAWPAQQRIHGDLHLGQIISSPGHPWVLVDFEGEPLRPMRERARLDCPLRDVAGMLRSFDYVAGSLATDDGTGAVAINEWVATARSAFADGYSAASGCDLRANRVVLDALEIDKALYEAVYEVRNRPNWLHIPVHAIERLATRVTH